MKVNGLEVPLSVVTVTGTDAVVPASGGTATRQLVCWGQAMTVTCAPKSTLIWPDGLTKLVPVITTICPGAPLDGSRAESTGPPFDDVVVGVVVDGVVVVEVVVGTGPVAEEPAGGGVLDEELDGGLVAGVLAVVAERLRGTDDEVEWEVGVPPPRIDDKLTNSTTTVATKAAEITRMDRLGQRLRREDAVDPLGGEGAGTSTTACVGGGAGRPSTSVRGGSPPGSERRERRAASAMAARARALGSWSW